MIAFAGGQEAFTVCSHLGGSGGGCCQIMQYLDRFDATSLKQVCKELYDMVKDYETFLRAKQEKNLKVSSWPTGWPLGRLQGHVENIISNAGALAGLVLRPNSIIVACCLTGQLLEYDTNYARKEVLAEGLERPTGLVALQDGTLFIAETDNHCIKMLSKGRIELFAGDPGIEGYTDTDRPTHTRGLFSFPVGLAVDSQETFLYIADSHNHAIRKVCLKTRRVSTVICYGLCEPHGLCFGPNGDLYIADSYNNQIQVFNDGLKAIPFQDLNRPTSVLWHNDALYVVDSNGSHVRSSSKSFHCEITFRWPFGICAGNLGSLLVTDVSGIFEIT
jgi:hypothetical protein